MQSYLQFRQRVLNERLKTDRVMFHEIFNSHLDLLKQKLVDTSRLPFALLENHMPSFVMHEILNEDFSICKEMISGAIDHYKNQTAAIFSEKAIAAVGVDELTKELTTKITDVMSRLDRDLTAAMVSYTSSGVTDDLESDDTMPTPAGSGGVPSGSAGYGGVPSGSAGSAGSATGPNSKTAAWGGTPPITPPGSDASWDREKPSFWRRIWHHPLSSLINVGKSIGKGIARTSRRWVYDDPTLEHIQSVLVERTASYKDLIKMATKELIDYINTDFIPKLKSTGTPTAAGPTAAGPTAAGPTAAGPTDTPPLDNDVDTNDVDTNDVDANDVDTNDDGNKGEWSPFVPKYKWPRSRINFAFKEFGQKVGDPRFENGLVGFGRSLKNARRAVIEAVAKDLGIKKSEVLPALKIHFDDLPAKDQKSRIMRLVGALASHPKYQLKFGLGEPEATAAEVAAETSPEAASSPSVPPETVSSSSVPPEAELGTKTAKLIPASAKAVASDQTADTKKPVAPHEKTKIPNTKVVTTGKSIPFYKNLRQKIKNELSIDIDDHPEFATIADKIADGSTTFLAAQEEIESLLAQLNNNKTKTSAPDLPNPNSEPEHANEPQIEEPKNGENDNEPQILTKDQEKIRDNIILYIKAAKSADMLSDEESKKLLDKIDDIITDVEESGDLKETLRQWFDELIHKHRPQESFQQRIGRLRHLIMPS